MTRHLTAVRRRRSARRPAERAAAVEVLTRVREARRGSGRHWREWLDLAYTAIVATAVVGSMLGALAVHAVRQATPTALTPHLLAAAPVGLTALGLLVLLVAARDSLWRGPVGLSAGAVGWLLPSPVDRATLLRPRVRRAAVLATAGGGLAGAIVAALLASAGLPASLPRLFAAAAGSVALLGLLATAIGALGQRYHAVRTWIRRVTPVAAVAVAALVLAGWLAPRTGRAVVWTGPWGWAAQPALAALGDPATAASAGAGGPAGDPAGGAAWPIALALLAVTAVAAYAVADRVTAGIPAAVLRERAGTTAELRAAAAALDSRSAALARRRPPTSTRRIRPPAHARAVIVWRDATALLRRPAATGWAVLLAAAALGLGCLAAATHAPALPLAAALTLGYLAAGQLTEPARLDADDPTRAAQMPYAPADLALAHGLVPLGVLLVIGLLLSAPIAVSVGGLLPVAAVAGAVPPLVAASLVQAYRGLVPWGLLQGAESPFGNTMPVQVLGWQLAGPLVAVGVLEPALAAAMSTAAPLGYLGVAAALTAGLAAWSRRRAARLSASSR